MSLLPGNDAVGQSSLTPSLGRMGLWGGLECSIVRVGDGYRNQIKETGHARRLSDLDRIASLGIRTLRYPILWESVSSNGPHKLGWRWHDRRVRRLNELGIRVIAGLLHHGSGPKFTDLLDPKFPELFAGHALKVAAHYPSIEMFTPINEPLTTARFAGLYGHWHPHHRSYHSFLRALVNECLATVLAMRAINRVNPRAKFLQTEDIGKTFSTSELAAQADHENERRWLSLDLLCGRVTSAHPWHRILIDHGIREEELALFLDGSGVPHLIGMNYYATGERFLDHRFHRYPRHYWGGNGRDQYADVEAVRVSLPEGDTGPEARLREVWERYRIPMVVSEAHIGCTPDEQIRWLVDFWKAAQSLRRAGADIRAVTAWALFGAVDWDSLLTRNAGRYEPGAFDVRVDPPRATPLATAIRRLAQSGTFEDPMLRQPGWWRREDRFYPEVDQRLTLVSASPHAQGSSAQSSSP